MRESREHWQERVAQWRSSGLTAREFWDATTGADDRPMNEYLHLRDHEWTATRFGLQ
jgi:hypothetical protein